MINDNDAAIAVYETHAEAEASLKELQRCGFDMKRLSIMGKDFHTEEHVVGYYNSGERMKRWGKTGAFWGGIWGILFGSALFLVPGFGPVVVAGPLVANIIAGLEGAAVLGGLGAIGAGLYGSGIPKDSVVEYEEAVKAGQFVLLIQGTAQEVERARGLMSSPHVVGVKIHTAPERPKIAAISAR